MGIWRLKRDMGSEGHHSRGLDTLGCRILRTDKKAGGAELEQGRCRRPNRGISVKSRFCLDYLSCRSSHSNVAWNNLDEIRAHEQLANAKINSKMDA